MASSSSQRRCVFVGNIPYDATEEQLMQICEEVGPVVSFRLVLDRETGKPKGYGFCEYKDEETALSARRNLHGYEINGRQLRVDFAENDKSTDRGREQGRGGPGLASSTGAPSILGDSSLHQPIGQQLAASAASAMAKALGEAQTSGMSSSGPQGPSGADPLTHYLAKISRHQLSQVMTEMKALATQNGPLARQLLQSSLQLPKALFQAQIMLNMVTPQMLQMPNLRQPSLDGLEAQKPIIPPFHGQSVTQPGILAKLPDGQVSGLAQSHLIPVQPQLQHLPSAQAQHLSQAVLLGKPGVPAFSQPLGGLSVSPLTSVVTSKGLLQQIQTPSLQQDRLIAPTAGGIHSNISIQQPLSGRLPSTQRIPSAHIPGEHGAYASLSYDSAWGSQARMAQDGDHPSKRLKLEEVTSAPQAGGGAAFRTRGGLAQAADAGLPAASQMIGADGTQQPDKQALQLPQDMHKVLLEQVKSLTAEQLSLLPPEQRQQVIDLQQRLRLLEGLDAAS